MPLKLRNISLGSAWPVMLKRIVFRSSSTAIDWVRRNKYFNLLSKGVERDGWRFVVLARFSPIPSYVINYGLAATKVGFLVDFLLPTVIGCLPMILQNTSIGSLAGAAVASTSGSQKSKVWSYIFPLLGILSSILISLRIKKYSTGISVAVSSPRDSDHDCNECVGTTKTLWFYHLLLHVGNCIIMLAKENVLNRKRFSVADVFWQTSWDGTANDRHDEIRNQLVYGWLGASIYEFKTGQFGDSGFVQLATRDLSNAVSRRMRVAVLLKVTQRRSKADTCTKL
ncbi:hypothetical protein RJ640_000114 [Escallonia rubra]|uniref:VTT domain-containing protein n=1 Tax=Escallonia rubra TaxID=112253 RepID=A0AA88R682_9ASTE|nr:hypothetical protein RJ640_000114 [Escallonia rubra]